MSISAAMPQAAYRLSGAKSACPAMFKEEEEEDFAEIVEILKK